jgi:hypothetical protein
VFQRKPSKKNTAEDIAGTSRSIPDVASIPPTEANLTESGTDNVAPAKKKVNNKLMSLFRYLIATTLTDVHLNQFYVEETVKTS